MSTRPIIDKRVWILTGFFVACFLGLFATGVAMQLRSGDGSALEMSACGSGSDSACPATGVTSTVKPLSCSDIHAGLRGEAREPLPTPSTLQ